MLEWIPVNATAASFEKVTLLGPLCRLGVFAREWVNLCDAMRFTSVNKVLFTAVHRPDILLRSRKTHKNRYGIFKRQSQRDFEESSGVTYAFLFFLTGKFMLLY